ncbi:MAG: hypothetical protein GC186_19080 [Rhodobacteraceae bacterium]|nr:hypothetical protein [Paracoccaceae bacterium]
MTMRLMVLSTAKNTDSVLEALKRVAGDEVEVMLHVGDTTADFKASTLSRMNARMGTKGHLMQDTTYRGAARALEARPDYCELRDEFEEHMMRTADSYRYKSHPMQWPHEFHDYYRILCDVIAARLLDEKITHCLFFNVPHLSYDTVLFHVAESLGIPSIIVSQSLFPDLYFSMRHPRDLGGFDPASVQAAPWPIAKGQPPELFYMKGVKQEHEEGGRITPRAVLQLVTFLATKRPWQAFNPVYIWRLVRRMHKIYGALPKWRDPFARFFHEDELAYFDHIAGFENQTVDLEGDYVYVALQLQPEMTTSALGGRFHDQALAIERIAALAPPRVRILVKENPKQGAYQRGPLFFHRLKRIPAVTFLPSWANTHALTERAAAVATITGTVGWEAICRGKTALIFGKAWYRKFPGVVEYRDDLTWDEIVAAKPDHTALEAAMGALAARMHRGVIDRHYTQLVPDYDVAANDEKVAKTLLGLLKGEVVPTYG